MKIPRRYAHFIFGVLQSGVTCAVASGIAILNGPNVTHDITHWLTAWGLSWVLMLPVVILVAPILRLAVERVTSG